MSIPRLSGLLPVACGRPPRGERGRTQPRRTHDAQRHLGGRPGRRAGAQAPHALWPRRIERHRSRGTASLLFTSARPDPDRSPDDKPDTEPVGLWSLPSDGGEARLLVAPGAVARRPSRPPRSADVVVVRAPVHPGTSTLTEDAARETTRTKAGVSARLYEGYPIRFWDHYLGPREDHLFLLDLGDVTDDGRPVALDLTPDAGRCTRRDRVRRAARRLRRGHRLDALAGPGPSDPGPGAHRRGRRAPGASSRSAGPGFTTPGYHQTAAGSWRSATTSPTRRRPSIRRSGSSIWRAAAGGT